MVAGFLAVAGLADAQTKLVLGHSTPTTDPCHQSALIFAKEFEKLTKGKYVVEVYPADQLGKYDEQTQALRAGTQDIQLMDPNALDRYDTLAGLHVYPFLFRDADHFFKTYRGPGGRRHVRADPRQDRRAAERRSSSAAIASSPP